MDCRITSDKSNKGAGFTLSETVVTLGITGIVLVALATIYLFTTRSFVTLKNHLDLDSASTRAMDRMSQEIRQADRLVSFSTNRMTLERAGASYSFIHLADQRALVRRDMQGVQVLLQDCDQLRFDFYQRNALPGGEGFYPALRPDLCKVVQVTWESSKRTGVSSPNASALRSAQIVIRNQKEL